MKAISLFLLLYISSTTTFAQLSNDLCAENEKVVFAFQLANKKWVSLCEENKGRYLVYRFGTNKHIELIYPEILDSSSWQKFSFEGYSRGGGKQNAAINYAFLSFQNKQAQYEIYETWNSEEDKEYCGIKILLNGQSVNKKGVLTTRTGYLLSLRNNEKIKQEADQ